MASSPPIHRSWVLVAPGPEDVKGRPDLYWSADGCEWSDNPNDATEYTAAERDALDLAVFDDDVEWWERQSS